MNGFFQIFGTFVFGLVVLFGVVKLVKKAKRDKTFGSGSGGKSEPGDSNEN